MTLGRLLWKETAEVFRASWDKVFDAVDRRDSFPYRDEDEQGTRSGPSRRIAPHGPGRPAPVLKKSGWLRLNREENLKTGQRFRLRDLLRCNLRTVRAYLLGKPPT
jgi:transposase